ncbi:MAG: EpsG family protein [Synergistaceae bacterium]|nr:EpsG family protein [Synergistaceae bacterium]
MPARNLSGGVEAESRWRKHLLFFSALPLFMLLALRYQVGMDYIGYSNAYAAISRYGFFESVQGYTAWLGNGFVYFCKLIALFFGENFLWYHAVLAALSIIFLYMAIFENSKMPLLSLFIYLCDGYYYMSFNQSRQGLAILIVFFSYKYILEDRFMPFALTVWAASLIHPSAWVFLPAFFLAKSKFNVKTALVFAVAGLVLTNAWGVVEGLVVLTRYSHYMMSSYQGNVAWVETTVLRALYRAGVFGLCLFFRRPVLQKYPNADCLYVLCTGSLVLQAMSLRSYVFARTVLYYYIGMLLLIPYVVKSIGKKSQVIILAALAVIFTAAHIYYFAAKADTLLAPVYRTFLWE